MTLTRKRGIAAMAMALVTALAVAAMTGDQNDAETEAEDHVELTGPHALLFGQVVDARTRASLSGVTLEIDQEGGRLSVNTDEKGRYRVVVNASRPIGMTVDVAQYQGAVAFGKICPGERRELPFSLSPAQQGAPSAPVVLEERCPRT